MFNRKKSQLPKPVKRRELMPMNATGFIRLTGLFHFVNWRATTMPRLWRSESPNRLGRLLGRLPTIYF
jgi:hypothetical protein